MSDKKLPRFLSQNILEVLGITFLISIVFLRLSVFEKLELKSYDERMALKSGSRTPHPDLIIITIDRKSQEAFGDMPWKRSYHAQLVDILSKYEVSAILFDVFFPDSKEEDNLLADSFRRSGKVFIALESRSDYDRKRGIIIKNLFIPPPLIKNSAAGSGFVDIPRDTDGFIRQARFLWEFPDHIYKSLPLEVLSRTLDLSSKEQPRLSTKEMVWDKLRIPVDEEGYMYINFIGKTGSFPSFSYFDVLQADKRENKKINGQVPLSFFKGKLVLIGSTADPKDKFLTPVSGGIRMIEMPGIEIQANILNTILQGDYIFRAKPWINFIILISIIFLTAFASLRMPLGKATLFVLGLLLLLAVSSVLLFVYFNRWIDLVRPLAAGGACFLVSAIYQNRKIKEIFSQFLPKALVEKMVVSDEYLTPGGKKEEVTILFYDIEGYTSFSEKMDSQEVMKMLNQLYSAMGRVVQQYDGTIFDYMGDASMVVFGAPKKYKDHPKRAILAALEMQEELKKLWRIREKEGQEPLQIGLGVNTGQVSVGILGTEDHKQYTAIGDATNIAARLQAFSKKMGHKIIVSEDTYVKVKNEFIFQALPPAELKGKSQPLPIYEVIGKKEDIS